MAKRSDRPVTSSLDGNARHVLLDAHEVMERYNWGQDQELVPTPTYGATDLTHENRQR